MKVAEMGKFIKRVGALLIVGFVIFFVVSYPAESANALKLFGQAIKGWFWQIYDFFANLG